jgi:MFS family permease
MHMKRENYKWLALALLFVAFFLHQGTRQIFGAMLPQIQGFFGASRTEIGVVGTIFQLAYGISLPFAGLAADMFGRKRMVVLGVAMFCGGIFLGGFSASVGALALAYGLMNGSGQAAYYPGMTSLISQLHSQSRATAFSIIQCGLYGGILICSVLAGWVAGWSEEAWRIPFWAFGGIGLAWAVVLAVFLENTRPPADARKADAKPTFREAFAAILPKRSMWLITFALGMMIYVDVGFKIWTPTFLRDSFAGLTPATAALHAVLWHYLGAFCGISAAARFTDRFAAKRCGIRIEVNMIGLAAATPFIVLMARSGSLPLCCVAMGLFGFFRGVYDSNILAALFDVVSPRYHATASSLMLACAATMGSAAPAVLGWIGDHASLRSGFTSLAVFYLAGAAALGVARVFFVKKEFESK